MREEMTIKEWIEAYDKGEFKVKTNKPDAYFPIACNAGWYDWFCSDKHCVNMIPIFAPKIKALVNSPKVDVNKMYVWFKNNCPCVGGLYDDFRIADMETGDVIFTIEHINSKWVAYGRENDFEKPLAEGRWNEVKKWFLANA